MTRIRIPKNAGQFTVAPSAAGTPLVTNGKSGGARVHIPCKSYKQAVELCARLNALDPKKEHEIWLGR